MILGVSKLVRTGAVVVSVAAGIGMLAVLAAITELHADDSPPPPGWTNYTPPWPIPVLIIGLALSAASAVAGGLLLVRRSRAGRRAD